MSRKWGSYGWATLHSVASLYPDAPTPADRAAAMAWLQRFTDTIVCPSCRRHFGEMTAKFQRQFDIFANKHQYFWFTVKAHNMVNARLGHPQMKYYQQAADTYCAHDFSSVRAYYWKYIAATTSLEQGMEGAVRMKQINWLRDFDRTTLQGWLADTDWAANKITEYLASNPYVTIDFDPAATAKIVEAAKPAAARPPILPAAAIGYRSPALPSRLIGK